ncbi:MAG TPA: leucyl aminopeptidase [Massilibacterium sp.]|nr:leucyl aminopeptidase [Massilibacterium sp.]
MFMIQTQYQKEFETEALIVGLFNDTKPLKGAIKEIDEALNGAIHDLIRDKDIKKDYKKISKVHTFHRLGAKRLYFVGLGKKEKLTFMKVRDAFGALVKTLRKDNIEQVGILLDTFSFDSLSMYDLGRSLGEACTLASYEVIDYKEKANRPDTFLKEVTVFFSNEEVSLKEGLEVGKVFGEGTNFTRTLVNRPGNLLTPTDLAEEAVELAKQYGMEYEVLEKEEMERLGMGGLLAVNQGSDEPPKMIVLKYRGKEKWENVLSFVGKGITFDAGGISLKPAKGMEEMKSDMGGAASVLGAMKIIGELKPDVNVLAVIPSTENLINGSALKPGDVITALSGKTIEVKNTDAEGRLVLADGVSYAKQLGADYIVDIATLTGAVLVALGDSTTGAVTNDEAFFEMLLEAAMDAGEYVWRLPTFEPYHDLLKTSDMADLNNSPGRLAGSITAGLFIGAHIEGTPWIHLDIAGTAYLSKATDLGPKGGTGAMVRTLAILAEQFQK